jgi:hypothetical protein
LLVLVLVLTPVPVLPGVPLVLPNELGLRIEESSEEFPMMLEMDMDLRSPKSG